MREIVGNLWDVPNTTAIVITTNGFVKKDGRCVMGRGCAKEAAKKWPDFPKMLGQVIDVYGNHVGYFEFGRRVVYSFPVKHNWWEKADLDLIKRSAHELVEAVDEMGDKEVVIVRPGCGNGQLNWEDVKPILEPIFDDRFSVITFE